MKHCKLCSKVMDREDLLCDPDFCLTCINQTDGGASQLLDFKHGIRLIKNKSLYKVEGTYLTRYFSTLAEARDYFSKELRGLLS